MRFCKYVIIATARFPGIIATAPVPAFTDQCYYSVQSLPEGWDEMPYWPAIVGTTLRYMQSEIVALGADPRTIKWVVARPLYKEPM